MTREIAYALKAPTQDGFTEAVAVAAKEMAPLVSRGSVLVPIPSSSGSLTANRALADAIANRTGVRVVEALRRERKVERSHARRIAGRAGLSPDEHCMENTASVAQIRADETPLFVDNVITTGSTFEAARAALGRGRGLAFADATRTVLVGPAIEPRQHSR